MLSYEFIAMLLVIVYVGAIATLFLFVVMMVDVGKAIKSDKKITALATIVSIVLCVEILLSISNIKHSLSAVQVVTEEANFNNTKDLGMIIYTDFFYGFQLVGFILFVAMVGVVHVISTSGAMDSAIPQKRQSSIKQILRNPKSSISIVKVKSRSGVSDIEGNDN
jgi:NADH-quinone oxidoreductase subunit J